MRVIRDVSAAAVVLMALVVTPGAAQVERSNNPLQVVRATGEAIAYTQPDQVQLDIGVMTESESAEQAAKDNAAKVESVLATLRRELGSSASIRTINYSLYPDYREPMREGGGRPAQYYRANNIIRVETGQLDKVGRIADLAIGAGANMIQSVNFMLRDQGDARARALREAAEAARAKVEVMAGALGLRVIRVLTVEEGGSVTPLYMERMQMEAARSSTPIEPGSVEVRALVTVSAEVALAR